MMVLTSSLFAKNDTDYVGRVGVRTDAIRFNKQGYLVVTGSGTWVVVWNQSAVGEAAGDHRIVSSRSPDRGKTWSEPHIIERDRQGCWLSPVYVETQNRIYGFYWHDADGNPIRDAGVIVFRYSDDEGVTWSPRFPGPDGEARDRCSGKTLSRMEFQSRGDARRRHLLDEFQQDQPGFHG